MPRVLPMFPLGSALFPHALLPLHVFEPRYRALTEHCLAGDHEFGVVLIERGSEVGGGDTRFDVGTLARIVQAGKLDDGRYVLLAAGVQRIRVIAWLADDPYPRAEVELLDERAGDDAGARVPEVERLLRRVLGIRAELGEAVAGFDVSLDDDAVRASCEAAALSPLGPLDAQHLLAIDDAGDRLQRLEELLTDEAEVLELRLAQG